MVRGGGSIPFLGRLPGGAEFAEPRFCGGSHGAPSETGAAPIPSDASVETVFAKWGGRPAGDS